MSAASADPGPKGRLITFEGGEGAGKSTQIGLLSERLARTGIEVVSTREPGGSPRAEKLREFILSGRAAALGPLGEAILFAAARIDHLDTVIAPALRRGAIVLCDRFSDSTRAYQGVMGEAEPRMIALLEKIALGDLRPDLTIVLDIPVADGLARAATRRGAHAAPDRFEGEEVAFHEGLRRAFLNIAAGEADRCCVVDALAPKEEVAQAIWQLIEARFLPAEELQPA
ncbi:dTMP kinase [Methylocystis heyeri]|uniref:Thymidylate kinase n=1 Tax=Methylocystis heyeri TaxID=391905 RepID=A0A6B8KCV5_9HYPH|nr:dTMP kinase [Methylocystis heyeri]QGM44855.1 dTMP kinase [Methylocystis heyeri]